MKSTEETKAEAMKALNCLFIAVDESVAKDVNVRVISHFQALEKEIESLTGRLSSLGDALTYVNNERNTLKHAVEYSLDPLKVIGKLGHCSEGGEQSGNQMHVWEAIKVSEAALKKVKQGVFDETKK